jgi:hypothetical protein
MVELILLSFDGGLLLIRHFSVRADNDLMNPLFLEGFHSDLFLMTLCLNAIIPRNTEGGGAE